MRPTGKLHLGNYMGALANWVKLQDQYECYFFIADWHALTTDYADTSQHRGQHEEVLLDYLAAGLDPEKSVLFLQSRVPQHAELALLLGMSTPLGWLERVPSYKEMQENLTNSDLTTYVMAVGEHILAHALFWPALFVLLFARPLKPLAAVILLASAIGLLFSYESQIFLCAPPALLALWRFWREKSESGGWTWVVFLTAATLFFAGITIGLCAVLVPELPRNFIGFKAGTMEFWTHLGWTLTWTIAWAGLMLVACFSERFWQMISSKGGFYLLFTAVAVWGTWPLLAPGRLDNGTQYDNRVLDTIIPLALLPVALILRFRPQWFEIRRERIVPLVAAMFIAQSLWQISATVNWYRDVVWMREILAAKSGIVKVRSTALAVDGMEGRELYKDAMGGRFDWVWPCLSIAIAPNQKINCLICSEVYLDPEIRKHFWQPFDPLQPETLPNLDHYGLDFSGYAAAVRKDAK